MMTTTTMEGADERVRDAAEAVRSVRAYADRRMVGVEGDGRDAAAAAAAATATKAKAKAVGDADADADVDMGFVTPPMSPARRKAKECARVVYSDRFVPSRATSMGFRGEFSMLDAEGEEEARDARDARDAAARREATNATNAAGANVNADDNVTPHGATGANGMSGASDREDTSAA